MPAYRAARGESPITWVSKPNRVRVYSTHTTAATTIATTNPKGTVTDPSVKVGHVAASGSVFPWGNSCPVADVSRQ